jgi:hypothetical protein
MPKSGVQAALLVLLAGAAGARIVAADLGCRAAKLLDRGEVMMVVVAAMGAVDMAGGAMIVVMIVVAVRTVDMTGGGLPVGLIVCHRALCSEIVN